ncbi:helix-turn-helix domain-containing protein [Ectopseudomonas oleovorans]|uniref:HTH iclR-type domain-containing protein n=1 Tax=Ectopseudomonas oleovorans (strain CECT 5344) TaxID=1182590 RepID=W6R2E1_ECTO5|nr:helix-turn-helix domain-containing protein [Pseudomonas oleovorans]CDM42418.1 hypothetical protein BN5_3876 [Pseudomonas oleovorans CECT 5344]CDR93041.1 hypothetical protein PPSAL_3817 [Pseudomonas oleovorans]
MMATGRKPVHLEQRGGKSNRQRVWEAIRQQRSGLTCYDLARRARVTEATVRTYLQALINGGYLEAEPTDTPPSIGQTRPLRLIRDSGSEAPALKRDGTSCTQGLGTEAMWRALRILGETSAEELARYASAAVPTTTATAKSYLRFLALAGYVQVARRVGKPSRYRMVQARYSGPRPPMIQRTKQVYDPNLGKVVWAEAPEDHL